MTAGTVTGGTTAPRDKGGTGFLAISPVFGFSVCSISFMKTSHDIGRRGRGSRLRSL